MSKRNSSAFNKDVEFITYDLPKDHKASCKAWLPSLEEFDDALLKFENAGFKVSSKWDEGNNCYAVFVSPPPKKKDFEGMILTGRGSTPLKAVKNAMYQHYFIFEQSWAAWFNHSPLDDMDD